jgi:hypothetical protein
MVTLPPSKVNTLLDLVEPLVPDTRKLVSAHGQQFSVAAHIRLGVLTDLSFDNRTGAIHRLALAHPHVTGGDLSAVLDAIEADAQEGTQQSS